MSKRQKLDHGEGPSNPRDTEGLCLLSLDGGGVRGLSTLYVLKHIMNRLNAARKEKGLESGRPCEVFDVIGGTSTGGLIAIMLGRLEMDVDECIQAYTNMMKGIFERSEPAKTATFSNVSPSIVEAALATSAATSYFETATIGNRKFVDGGLAVNNPAEEVEWEARDIWCTESGLSDIKELVSCFVSIGTGVPSPMCIEESLQLFATSTMPNLISETERTEKKIVARWHHELDNGRFFRFNVDQGLQNVGLADYQQEGRIDASTTTYLNHQMQLSRVRDCVKRLVLKQSVFTNEQEDFS
ncbi:hypothetical protein LTR49_012526 [Elasticomyces elasticus]|nr:hypothetical protein LTR49_012526 [Elasticomyces elasticus]